MCAGRGLGGVLAFLALLLGCARGPLQPLPPARDGATASVTFRREATMVGAALSYYITVDDQAVYAIRAGDRVTIPVPAGWRAIGIRCPGEGQTPAWRSFDKQLEAGEQYYFRVGPDPIFCATIRPGIAAEILPKVELTLKGATLAEVRAKLFGEAGLVRGPQRYEVKFEQVTLTAQDVWALGTLLKDARVSPLGSHLTLEGTVEGAKFKAQMEVDEDSRSHVKFEGVVFESEQQVEEFLAPLSAEHIDEIKIAGTVAGRPLQVRRASEPPFKGTFKSVTLDDIEAKLFGESGLVRGARRFEIAFEQLALTTPDMWRLRTFINDAIAAPSGSELKFEGTIDGTKFKAKLEKEGRRSRLRFDGLVFKDRQQLKDFLAPFSAQGIDDLKLDVSVAGLPFRVTGPLR